MNAQANTFNPELFLNLSVNEANSTDLVLLPEGEYEAVSGPVSADSFRSFDISRGEKAGTKGYALDIIWEVNDDSGALKELLGRQPKARQSISLDMRADMTLEFGKGRNVELGRLREALGQNMTGRPWAFSHLGGQPARIKVKHRTDANTGKTYVEVKEVSKL